jgi:outer membrane protein OmpA-like peptidoglycan-associated protein
MKNLRFMLLCLAVVFAAKFCAAQAKDADGCKDSPLISRFPGSIISSCKQADDDVYSFEMGPGKPVKKIEGKFFYIHYNYPKTATKPQVLRNLKTALKTAGYIMDYDSGDYGDFYVHLGKTWIYVGVSGGFWYDETIVVETTLTQDVVANAAALDSGLTASGHTVVTGILFDTGKADVKPESAPALQEVAKLLKQHPTLKVYVVGHTDNVGALAANIDLSKRRAAAVVLALTTQYGVAAARLQAYGDGPYAPIASNHTEDGKTLNRRVELVEQ